LKLRLSVILISIAVLAATVPLAYASPPDPIWIGGLYDDDDLDNVVVFITWATGIVESFQLEASCPLPTVIALLPRADDGPAFSQAASSARSRAPPHSAAQ